MIVLPTVAAITTASSLSHPLLARSYWARQDPPSRRALFRNQYRQGRLLVISSFADPAQLRRLQEHVQEGLLRRSMKAEFVNGDAVSVGQLESGAVAIVGPWDFWRNHMIVGKRLGSMSDAAPDTASHASGEVTQLILPNPWNPQFPMTIITGGSDDAILEAVKYRRRADIHRRLRGRTTAMDFYDAEWRVDPSRARRYGLAETPTISSEVADIFLDAGAQRNRELEDFVESVRRLRAEIERRFPSIQAKKSEIHVYPDQETKGLITESSKSASRHDSSTHVVLGLDEAPLQHIARSFVGQVPIDASESTRMGLAIALSASPRRLATMHQTMARLLRTSDPPELAQWETLQSPLIKDALAGSMAAFALQRTQRTPGDLGDHELAWRRWVSGHERDAFEPVSRDFHRGMTFSHEGFQIFNGYLSNKAKRSLARLAEIQVDSVSVIPYSFLNGPDDVGPLPIPERAGSETDEDVVHAIRRARAQGMHVLLKPQIWVRRAWPGDIGFGDPNDESSFKRNYSRWIRHYALMAQQEEVPMLAIGTEMAKMTHERREYWKRLIADIREIYDGKLVYAANWGEEVEQVDFWPLLDYIGCDFYYPLSFDDDPSDSELRRGFEAALDKLELLSKRYGRPVLLTEIGYASTPAPWKKPHASDQIRELGLEDQARAYRIAFDALEDETSWLKGLYWWEWPSDLDVGGVGNRGFTPNGKPAEAVIRNRYRAMNDRPPSRKFD